MDRIHLKHRKEDNMTQKDKELSFIDISGRLHYGVIVNYKEDEYDYHKWKITNLHILSYSKSGTLIDTDWDGWISYEENEGCGMSSGSRPFRFGEVLPYLRPMSSMTDKEKKDLLTTIVGNKNSKYFQVLQDGSIDNTDAEIQDLNKFNIHWISFNKDTVTLYLDWLNKKMFDYRGLIKKGLAIEAPEEMYKESATKG